MMILSCICFISVTTCNHFRFLMFVLTSTSSTFITKQKILHFAMQPCFTVPYLGSFRSLMNFCFLSKMQCKTFLIRENGDTSLKDCLSYSENVFFAFGEREQRNQESSGIRRVNVCHT